MPRWTPESRAKQAELAKANKPWTKSTGPKTDIGKFITKMNSYKHGDYSDAAIQLRRLLRGQSRILQDCIKPHSLQPAPFSLAIADEINTHAPEIRKTIKEQPDNLFC